MLIQTTNSFNRKIHFVWVLWQTRNGIIFWLVSFHLYSLTLLSIFNIKQKSQKLGERYFGAFNYKFFFFLLFVRLQVRSFVISFLCFVNGTVHKHFQAVSVGRHLLWKYVWNFKCGFFYSSNFCFDRFTTITALNRCDEFFVTFIFFFGFFSFSLLIICGKLRPLHFCANNRID